MPPGMSARYAFFFGLRFSLFFGLLSPMGYLLTGDESLANRDSAQDLLSAIYAAIIRVLVGARLHRNLRGFFPWVAYVSNIG